MTRDIFKTFTFREFYRAFHSLYSYYSQIKEGHLETRDMHSCLPRTVQNTVFTRELFNVVHSSLKVVTYSSNFTLVRTKNVSRGISASIIIIEASWAYQWQNNNLPVSALGTINRHNFNTYGQVRKTPSWVNILIQREIPLLVMLFYSFDYSEACALRVASFGFTIDACID